MKDYLFINFMFVLAYLSLFLFKTNVYIVLFFFYLLIINFYYFFKIEKLRIELQEKEDMLNDYKEVLQHEEKEKQ